MHKHQEDVIEFHKKAEQTVNIIPTMPSEEDRMLRARLILEEALEFIYELGVDVYIEPYAFRTYLKNTEFLEFGINSFREPNLENAYKEIVDLNYVTNGAAVTLGVDLDKGHDEVHTSNMSKFIDGYKDENGKWRKGKSYKPANMKELLKEQTFELSE